MANLSVYLDKSTLNNVFLSQILKSPKPKFMKFKINISSMFDLIFQLFECIQHGNSKYSNEFNNFDIVNNFNDIFEVSLVCRQLRQGMCCSITHIQHIQNSPEPQPIYMEFPFKFKVSSQTEVLPCIQKQPCRFDVCILYRTYIAAICKFNINFSKWHLYLDFLLNV